MRKLLCALPAPPMTSAVAHCSKRVCCGHSSRKNFRLFANRVLYLILLSLLSCNFELNPGPLTVEEMELLRGLQSGQATIMSKLYLINNRLAQYKAMLTEVNNRLGVAEGQVEGVNKLVSEQFCIIRDHARQVVALRSRSVDLKKRIRRQNLVFYGIDDDNQSETMNQSEQLVKSLYKNHLGIELQTTEGAPCWQI